MPVIDSTEYHDLAYLWEVKLLPVSRSGKDEKYIPEHFWNYANIQEKAVILYKPIIFRNTCISKVSPSINLC